MFCYWALLPFAIYGVVIARRRKVPVYPLLALVLIVVVAVIPTIGAVRYRAPAEIALVMLGAVGIEALVGRFLTRRGSTAAAVPVAPDDAIALAGTPEVGAVAQ